MSAYLVNPETFTRLYSGFDFYTRDYRWAFEQLQEACAAWDQQDDDRLLPIMRALYQLNAAGVNARYREDNREAMPGNYKAACRISLDVSLMQFLKSLHCIHYQMSEGNVPEHPVYKALEKLIRSIESRLISQDPAYAKAVWG